MSLVGALFVGGTMSDIIDTPIRGRYAPSPSGDLHLGNLRTALLAWLFARTGDGQFVLRVEDLDRPRVRPGATQRMLDDLHWLGLDWDEGPDCGGPYAPYTQSERIDIYQQYLHRLRDLGLVYPCYCSRAEITHLAHTLLLSRFEPEGEEDGPRYPGTCRQLTEEQRGRDKSGPYEARGRRPALRFRVDDERLVSFNDLTAGPTTQHVQRTVGDFIILRSDGIFAYPFAVVIDDACMHINQVVRGADLLSSTARQILLYEALGFPIPTFAHVPLMLDEHGKRLAKRTQSMGLTPLRSAGMTPAEVIGQLAASCGLVEQGEGISARELAKRYNGQTAMLISKIKREDH
jgi:glutamyl-tRNA synthetase